MSLITFCLLSDIAVNGNILSLCYHYLIIEVILDNAGHITLIKYKTQVV